jgi:hypothetical protein
VVVSSTFEECKNQSLLFTTALGGNSGSWIECKKAVLIPIDKNLSPAEESELQSYLCFSKVPVVESTTLLRNSLILSKTCNQLATPDFLRRKMIELNYIPKSSMCKFLLKYCLIDLKNDIPLLELNNLPVIPMEDNTVSRLQTFNSDQILSINELMSMGFTFTHSTNALMKNKFDLEQAIEMLTNPSLTYGNDINSFGLLIFIDIDDFNVFQDASNIFIQKQKLNPNEVEFLSHPNFQKYSNIRKFDTTLICDVLKFILPSQLLSGNFVLAENLDELQMKLLKSFLPKFWNYSATRAGVILSVAQSYSIVPCTGFKKFSPLSRVSNLMSAYKQDAFMCDNMIEILMILGVNFIDVVVHEMQPMSNEFWSYVHSPNRSGVLSALNFIERDLNMHKFSQLTVEQREELRTFISTCEPVKQIDGI